LNALNLLTTRRWRTFCEREREREKKGDAVEYPREPRKKDETRMRWKEDGLRREDDEQRKREGKDRKTRRERESVCERAGLR
jgi:hypothetical protein